MKERMITKLCSALRGFWSAPLLYLAGAILFILMANSKGAGFDALMVMIFACFYGHSVADKEEGK